VGVTFNRGGPVTEYQQQAFSQALNYLAKYPGMGEIINSLATKDLNVVFVYDGNDSYNPSTNTITWDHNSAMNIVQADGQVGAQSPALGLFHELCHWLYAHTGNPLYAEESATYIESQAAISLGEVVRPNYNSASAINSFVHVTNPTAHSGGGYWQAVDANGNPVTGPIYKPNESTVIITGGPAGSAGGAGAGGGGEHGGVGGVGSGTQVGGTGLGNIPGTGGTGGGHWQPVPQHLETPGPYDEATMVHEQFVTIVGTEQVHYE
jgi:hypothetical protein